MAKKKPTGKQALQALRDARYKYIQIQAACEEFGFHPVSVGMLSYVHKGKRPMSADLARALIASCKGMGVKL